MPTRRFELIALALLLVVGGVVFSNYSLIEHAQAQQQSAPPAPPPTATQSPVVNPSNPNTVPQPSYTPLKPSTQSTTASTPTTASSGELTPGHEETPSTRSARTPTAKTRSVRHHHYRGRARLATYSCGHLGCVRTYSWAFPCQYYSRHCHPNAYTASAVWWPGYYDYAAGQLGRGHPRYGGYGRRAGYHRD